MLKHLRDSTKATMEIDRTPSEDQDLQLKAETLQSLSTGPLPSSISKISGSSRGIPSGKDFHFYYNFDEFKSPVDEIAAKSQLMLTKIGSSKHLWDTEVIFSEDVDDAYDLVANINDEVLERFDMSVDEFTRIRKAEEEGGRGKAMVDENGFQLVCGRKKKATSGCGMKPEETNSVSTAVRVAERDKKVTGGNPKIPFHIPTIRRPQDEYNILVNNSNQPFQHAWLQRSDDGSRFIHPLENHSFLDFVDRNVENMEPMKPPPISSTPFKLVNDVKGLKELAAKLRAAGEFAVDLEHNQYRSFQGLTCLMQISTRTEDFVVDTLKLRIQIGPYLREIFKDPTKKKVIHGADSDILWLQRDFGIYVCNLFDTGQASRVLKLERNSLEYLLQHFCGVVANKEYQKADWRLRPLPMEMIRYAREDTHYLLYIYDLMRIRLLSESPESDKSDALLVEVYERSYKVCMQLYEKELLTDSSYLRIYGLQGANFNAQQLAIVAGLCEWRDIVARSEDESTGYILPNKTLLEIAKQMPVTTSKLRRLVRSKHPYVERNLSSVINIIRLAMQNAEVFEPVAQQLKEAAMQAASESNTAGVDGSEVSKSSGNLTIAGSLNENGSDKVKPGEDEVKVGNELGCCDDVDENKNVGKDSDGGFPDFPIESIVSTQSLSQISVSSLPLQKASGASVQVLKKPNRAFGALLGNSTTKKKIELNKGKEESKLEQIKSSVSLPFYAFSVADQQTKEAAVEPPSRLPNLSCSGERSIGLDASTASEDVIELENGSGNRMETPVNESAAAASDQLHSMEENAVTSSSYDEKDEPVSLFDLSSSFQKCLKSTEDKQQGSRVAGVSEKSGLLGFKPFDYATARKEVKFGERARKVLRAGGNEGSNIIKRFDKKAGMSDVTGDNDGTLPQGKRREAFPASGNRSATFR